MRNGVPVWLRSSSPSRLVVVDGSPKAATGKAVNFLREFTQQPTLESPKS
jgi:hypothetical protein